KSKGETLARLPPLRMFPQTQTNRSGSAKGNGRIRTAFTRLKIAVLAPMARARVMSAIAVNAGRFSKLRTPYRTSLNKVSIIVLSDTEFRRSHIALRQRCRSYVGFCFLFVTQRH